MVCLPNGLLSYVDESGASREYNRVLVGTFDRSASLILLNQNGDWSQPNILSSYGTSIAEVLEVRDQDSTGNIDVSMDVQARINRIVTLARRLVAGLLLALQTRANFIELRIRASLQRRTATEEPSHRVVFVGAPLKIDCRPSIRDFIEKGSSKRKGAPPQVQTLVRGHFRRQVCGVGRLQRKVIWIEPFWRGSDAAPDSDETESREGSHAVNQPISNEATSHLCESLIAARLAGNAAAGSNQALERAIARVVAAGPLGIKRGARARPTQPKLREVDRHRAVRVVRGIHRRVLHVHDRRRRVRYRRSTSRSPGEVVVNTLATKNARKYLRELTSGVLHWLHALDTEMKKPSSAERGRRIAAILNALDMANDVAMHYGLGLSFEAINRHKRDGVHAAVRKGSCVSHTRVLSERFSTHRKSSMHCMQKLRVARSLDAASSVPWCVASPKLPESAIVTSNRKGWCQLADKPCPPQCPVPSVDNSGNPLPGCAIFRFKTQAEIDAMTASTVASNECNCDPRPGTTDHYPACPASMYRAGIDRGRAEALEEAAKVADEVVLDKEYLRKFPQHSNSSK